MFDELRECGCFRDIWSAFIDRGTAGFTSSSAGYSIAFSIASAVAEGVRKFVCEALI